MIEPDTYVLDPIDPDEMDSIESQMGRKVPTTFRKIFMKVGFLQNAISGDWPQSAREFIGMQECIPDGHVAFMNDGAGNYFVVSEQDVLMFWDHETGELSNHNSDLQTFINESLRDPEPVGDQSWHVQMAFDVIDEQSVLQALKKTFVLDLSGQWEFKDTSPAGVSTHLLRINEAGKPGLVSKQTYAGWEHDIIYYNRVIPIDEIGKHRMIFRNFENDPSFRFKLVNYGILPTELGDDEDI